MAMMKRVVLAKPGHLRLEAVDAPRPAAGEALLRIRRIGVCGTDLHAYQGNQPFFSYPRVLGHELSGEVVAVGPDVDSVREGDRCVVNPYLACGDCIACRRGKPNCCCHLQVLGVHADGGMQEYLAIAAGQLIRTEGLTLDQMALVENQCIGAHAVRRAAIEPGERVAVVGAGPIGLGVIQFARLAGAQVAVLDIRPERLAFCRERMGVEWTISAGPAAVDALRSIGEGDLPTAVFDVTGNADSMRASLDCLAHGGRLVYVGLTQADVGFFHPDFHKKETTLLSSRNATREDFQHVIDALQAGRARVDQLVTHRVGLDDTPTSCPRWLDPAEAVIKALVEA